MQFPDDPSAQDLFTHVYQLTLKEGKMVSKGEFMKVRPRRISSVSTHKQITRKRRIRNYFRRNKRKATTAVIGITAAILTTATGANLVAIPLFFIGYGLKKGITALVRRKKYNFVKAFLLEAETHGNLKDLINEMTSREDQDQEKLLSTLRHWFTHRKGEDVSTYIDRIRRLRKYYARFKDSYNTRMFPPRKCDHVVETTQWMFCYSNMLDGIEGMTNVFTACYLYVLNAFNMMQEDFGQKYPVVLRKIFQYLYLGDHRACGKRCYVSGDGMGRMNYKGMPNHTTLGRLLQDAAHSRYLFKSGSKNRLGWVRKALGLNDIESILPETKGPTFGGGLKESGLELTKGVVFDPQAPLSSHMVQSVTGNIGTGWIQGKSTGEALSFTGEEGGFRQGVQGGLFSLVGENAAQVGANAFAFAGALAGPLLEVGNSILNKWQLKHSDTLGQKSIKHAEGIKRLDILRANLKGGLLESWVDAFLEFKKRHREFMSLSIMPLSNCTDAYHLTRAVLRRQKAFAEFMGPHLYAEEFYNGLVVKIARMTARWMIMARHTVTMGDVFFMRWHPEGHCGGTFCYDVDESQCELSVKLSQKNPDVQECKRWYEDINLFTQEQMNAIVKSFKHTDRWVSSNSEI